MKIAVNMGKWETARKIILARDNWMCIRCGAEATDVHHRKAKKMGGTKNEDIAYGYANLISVCRNCHSWIHGHPTEAVDAGYIVKTGFDPETTFIITKFGLLTLRADGTTDLQGTCDPYF